MSLNQAPLIILLGFLWMGSTALASSDLLRPLPGGVVFPEFNNEISINPGTLALEGAAALQASLEPALFGSSNAIYDANATYATPTVGGGVAFTGTHTSAGNGYPASTSSALQAGVGFRVDKLGIGIGYQDPIGSNLYYAQSTLNLGLFYGTGADVCLAAVVNDFGGNSFVTLGVGYAEKKKFNVEVNLTLPPFNPGLFTAGASYTLTGAVAGYVGRYGLAVSPQWAYSIPTPGSGAPPFINQPLGISYSMAFLVAITKSINTTLRIDRYGQLGLTAQYVF